MARSLRAKERNAGGIYLASLMFFVSAIVLAAYSTKNPQSARIGAEAFDALVSPIQSINSTAQGGIASIWTNYVNLIGAQQEKEQLAIQVKELLGENARLRESQVENAKLRALLHVTENSGLRGVAARVIGYDPSNWVKAFTVDQGSNAGIRVGMAVVDPSGLVGQVIAASSNSSRVLLITDHSSGVDAVVQDKRIRVVVEGLGGDLVRGNYVPPDETVLVGERVVGSGMDGVFPSGILIGTITEVEKDAGGLFQILNIRPIVDFAKLERVLIVTSQEVKP